VVAVHLHQPHVHSRGQLYLVKHLRLVSRSGLRAANP
jgi:hypothetical protein